jgi:peptidoglycan/LPS O-acetylase OafA/YrhL
VRPPACESNQRGGKRQPFGNYGSMAVNAVLGLVLTLGIASALYVAIERRCMRIRSHPAVLNLINFFKRSQPTVAVEQMA